MTTEQNDKSLSNKNQNTENIEFFGNENAMNSVNSAKDVSINQSRTVIYNYYYEQQTITTSTEEDIDDNLPCPYQGLYHFNPENTEYFFGREVFIEELYQYTETRNFIPVLGASGSGKSSVILAGLVPKLVKAGHWQFTHFRPGTDPFYALARALIPLYAANLNETQLLTQTDDLSEYLKDTKKTNQLSKVFEQIHHNHPNNRTLLIADQFEELYTLCNDEQTRRKFLDILLKTFRSDTEKSSLSTVLVATMRADFLGNVLSYPPLADVLRNGDIKIRSMNSDELREIIEKPAQKLKVNFEEGLVERILEDVDKQPGNLPLLEFALTELWKQRKSQKLTHKAYEEIGQVSGALTRYADDKFSKLKPEEQQQVHRIFVQLVHPGAGTEDTRRVATKAELSQSNWNLVKKLADARLVVTSRTVVSSETENNSGQETVEVVHEALIRNWGQLKEWMENDREFRAWQERLRGAMHQWEEMKRDKGQLLRGAALLQAQKQLKDRRDELSEKEQEFIQESKAEVERLLKAERRRKNMIVTATMGTIALLSGLSIFSWSQMVKAEKQSEIALARQLIAESESMRVRQKNLRQSSVLLAVESIRKFQKLNQVSVAADKALRSGLTLLPEFSLGMQHDRPVKAVTFSSDGKYVATASDDKTARVWDAATGKEIAKLQHDNDVWDVTFSPNGKYVATASDDKTARVWEATTGKEITKLQHDNWVRNVAFSRDGKYVATASDDKTARVWEATTGKEITKLQHDAQVEDVAFSPDGKYVATASDDKTARVWEATTGKEITKLQHDAQVEDVAFSPDGKYVATASDDKTARVWETATGKEITKLQHGDRVMAIEFSPDGKYVATASYDNTAKVWDAATGQEISRVQHDNWVRAVVFSSDSKYVATASGDKTAGVWDVATGQEISRVQHDDWVYSVAFAPQQNENNPDGKYIATASRDNIAGVWDIAAGKEITKLQHDDVVMAIEFSPDGKYIATGSWDNTARVSSATTGKEISKLQHNGLIMAVTFSPDSKYVATASHDNTAKVWNAVTGKEITKLPHNDNVRAVVFSSDGKYVATASYDNTAKVWDAVTGKEIIKLQHDDQVSDVVFSPDSKYVATASHDNTARMWEIATGKEITKLQHDREVKAVALSADGQYIATASWDKTVGVWYAATGKEITKLQHDDRIRDVKFSPDSKYIGSSSYDNTAKVWDTATGKEITKLQHDDLVYSVAFSPDSKYIATASYDNTAGVWDTATGKEITNLQHDDWVYSVAFSPDSKYIATASRDKTAGVTSLNVQVLVDEACRRLRRNLTAQEWEKYMNLELQQYQKTCENLPIHSSVISESQSQTP
ncbi:MAG: hypothetical protein F6K54_04120 [Okeania sp. SIO3B5]|uniref:WD40 repeat domain-containing protein n=1 Tax=Okeania sp. SIO3B5 TaxID=2607811 RepID=UPI00140176F7|nr:WD40 repeat domain-containing protein [Okeania sp. SIO3B5]NEO52334.1 hypothetical protein [Okeania sp. SIO3B5]